MYAYIMDTFNEFSLEDDKCPELFITQSSKPVAVEFEGEDNENSEDCEDFLDLDSNFNSGHTSELMESVAVYSDISDAEDFQDNRCVKFHFYVNFSCLQNCREDNYMNYTNYMNN